MPKYKFCYYLFEQMLIIPDLPTDILSYQD